MFVADVLRRGAPPSGRRRERRTKDRLQRGEGGPPRCTGGRCRAWFHDGEASLPVVDDAARDAFLDGQPALVAALGSLRADGGPWVVPVWYRFDGARFHVWSEPEYPWVRRLQADPRVAVSVFEQSVPLRAVYARGTATIRTGPLALLGDEIRAIVARYEPPELVDATIARYDRGQDRAIVTIEPDHLRAIVNMPDRGAAS